MTDEQKVEQTPRVPETEQELYEALTAELQTMIGCIPHAIQQFDELVAEEDRGDFYLDLLGSAVAGAIFGTFSEEMQEDAVEVVQSRIKAVNNILRGKEEDDDNSTPEIILPDKKIVGS